MDTVLLSFAGYAFTVPAVASIVAGLTTLALGVRVLLREQRIEASLHFLSFCIVLFVWLLSFGFMYAAPDEPTARRWVHTAYMAIPLIPATIYRFTLQVLGANPRRRMVMGTLWTISALLVVLFVGAGIFAEGMVRYPWGWVESLSPWGFVLVGFIVVGVGASLLEYGVAWRAEERPDRRRHLGLLTTAFAIGTPAIVDFLPAFGIAVPPIGYLPVLGGLLILAHVVQRHSLVELTSSITAGTVLRTMTDPVLVVEEDGSIRFANEAVREAFGWSPDRLEGESWRVLVDGGPGRETLERLIGSAAPADAEVRLRTREGEEVPAAVSASAVNVGSHRKVATVLVVKDLRGREAARRAMEKAEEKYAGLFELNPVAIGLAAMDGSRFLEVNRAFEEFFGVSREEAISRGPVDLDLWVDPADRERVVRAVEEDRAVDGLEVQMRAADGDVRDILFFADAIELEGRKALLAMAYDITERKAFEQELERHALYDSLTDLPNRTLLRDRLDHALDRSRRRGTTVCVLFLDLDRFKVVNDSIGHAAGDEVLRQTADRLRALVRDEDTVARMGGDEFVIVLETPDGPAESRAVARRIGEEISVPFTAEGEYVHLSVSTGIALAGEDAETAEDLLRQADIAMYRAKEESGSAHHVFDPATDRRATDRLREENDLRRAIEQEELVLHYQPVVRLATGRIVGVEALVRWDHPERGIVSPAEFIPLAEETGLIVPLGEWVARKATEDAVGWPADGRSDGIHVGVNVSARQLEDPGAVSRLVEVLESSAMSTSRLILEITESAAVRNREAVQTLGELGLRVAVDDLGTGYASLEYLTRLDVDIMKVDRMFVSGIGEDSRDEAIVEAAALIARRLEKSVVAEGIETEAQLRRLADLAYAYGQGYYFARPLPAGELETLLEEDPTWVVAAV